MSIHTSMRSLFRRYNPDMDPADLPILRPPPGRLRPVIVCPSCGIDDDTNRVLHNPTAGWADAAWWCLNCGRRWDEEFPDDPPRFEPPPAPENCYPRDLALLEAARARLAARKAGTAPA